MYEEDNGDSGGKRTRLTPLPLKKSISFISCEEGEDPEVGRLRARLRFNPDESRKRSSALDQEPVSVGFSLSHQPEVWALQRWRRASKTWATQAEVKFSVLLWLARRASRKSPERRVTSPEGNPPFLLPAGAASGFRALKSVAELIITAPSAHSRPGT